MRHVQHISRAKLTQWVLVSVSMLLTSCKDKALDIPIQPTTGRFFHPAQAISVHLDRSGSSGFTHFMFNEISDTLFWSESGPSHGYAWLYYSNWIHWGADPPDLWEFAFPPVTEFENLKAPDSYKFFGQANYQNAVFTYGLDWRDVAVGVDFTSQSYLILARRTADPYPIFCLKGTSMQVIGPDPSMPTYQKYNFTYRAYY